MAALDALEVALSGDPTVTAAPGISDVGGEVAERTLDGLGDRGRFRFPTACRARSIPWATNLLTREKN